MHPPLPCRWQDLTSVEIAALPNDAVAVLVLGAVEQHGAHLPLSTDLDIGQGLLEAAAETLPDGFPLVSLPPLAVGASEEHCSFPGTLSLPPETAIATLEAHGAGVARAGLRRLVLFSAHGGNNPVMDIAALRLRRRHGLVVVKSHYLRAPAPDVPEPTLPAAELRHGLHGGAVETAILRHLAPDKVRMDRAEDYRSSGEALEQAGNRVGPEAEGRLAWLAEDLHPAGVVGNARLGTAALGRQLVDYYADRLARLLQETRALAPPGGDGHS